ncbi:MAG: VOC family protein [bacterium]
MIEINETFPLYVSNDLSVLKNYYSEHFGFTAVFFDSEFYLHLLHPGSGHQIGFLVPGHDSQPVFLHGATNNIGVALSFDVSDAQAAFTQAVAEGLDIIMTYTEESWGQNHFMLRDPGGLIIDVVEHIEPVE